MTITPETIAELRGLMRTPRPWHVWDRGIGWEIHEGADAECLSEYGCNAEGCEPVNSGQRDTFSFPDATLIAAAVNALPALLDAAERLAVVEAERDALAASVARVRELHAPSPYADAYLRTVSPSLPAEVCGSCWMHLDSAVPYPCPTIRALDGSES